MVPHFANPLFSIALCIVKLFACVSTMHSILIEYDFANVVLNVRFNQLHIGIGISPLCRIFVFAHIVLRVSVDFHDLLKICFKSISYIFLLGFDLSLTAFHSLQAFRFYNRNNPGFSAVDIFTKAGSNYLEVSVSSQTYFQFLCPYTIKYSKYNI